MPNIILSYFEKAQLSLAAYALTLQLHKFWRLAVGNGAELRGLVSFRCSLDITIGEIQPSNKY
ncbi:MAG: hypothetical protein ACRED0_10850, partial [Gammaproteobacteria bacterium]